VSSPHLLAVLDGIQALLLDVDDTIVDTKGAMVEAGTVAAAAVWPEREGEHRAVAQRYYDDPERWFRRYAAGDVGFDAMRAGRLHEVARTLGLDLSEGAQRRYEEAYAAAFRTAQRLFPDVPPLLEAAEHAGLPVALLTNSAHAPTRVKLEALDLVDRFDVVVTTDTLGFGKPDARVYLEACRQVGAGPGSVVCLGDSLEWDVLGAQTAGLRAVWLDRAGAGTEQPVASVRGLDEVATALRADLGTRSGTGSIPLRFTTQKAARRARSETPWGMV
jgi:putative hydrolase of the HAD superfamily